MLFLGPDIQMSLEEFRLFRDFIYQHCGLHFTEDTKYLLEKRLGKRLQLLSLKNFKDYYYLLRYSPAKEQELTEVIDLLTTNETYFFREDFQLRTFSEEILPELRERKEKAGNRQLRIWSAGCSSGEEPYTIAMILLDQPWLRGWRIEVIGTDISQRVLQLARQGIYSESAFRTTDADRRQRFFTIEPDGRARVKDEVRSLVTVSHLNLFDTARVALLGRMDLIFCRNVIIYFDQNGKKKVVETFQQHLHPEGFLLLGHSESLINITTAFRLRHFKHDMVYQKPAAAAPGGGGLP
jgi:chemotaxis protein methyltransferase CheR